MLGLVLSTARTDVQTVDGLKTHSMTSGASRASLVLINMVGFTQWGITNGDYTHPTEVRRETLSLSADKPVQG
jgi:hypothetical protein